MKIHIPTPLRQYVEKRDAVDVPAKTVGEALDELIARHPDLQKHLYTSDGKLRSFVNLYLNDEDVRYLAQKEATTVSENDSLSIVPSIAGGTSGAKAPGCFASYGTIEVVPLPKQKAPSKLGSLREPNS